MKKYLFSLLSILCVFGTQAQESLIADIMQVDAVNINEAEKYQEALTEYQETYDEQIARLDEDLAALGEDYQKEVTDLIENFKKVLEDGIEQEARNEKKSVITQVTTLTMSLKANKKKAVQSFENEMEIAIRELPKTFTEEKTRELKDAREERISQIEAEYKANEQVIAAFRNTEHLIKTNEPVQPNQG